MRQAVAVLAASLAAASGAQFFVSNRGNDSNAGTSPGAAWSTLARASQVSLGPGDAILLERGGIWLDESLAVDMTGAPGASVGAYGDASLPRPLVEQSRPARASDASACVTVTNATRGATVSGLSAAGCAFGVVLQWGSMAATDVTVSDCFFRDIRFPLEAYNPSAGAWGPAVSVAGLAPNASIANLTVQNNIALRVDVVYRDGHNVHVTGLSFVGNTMEGCGGNCVEADTITGLVMSDNVFLRDTPDRFFIYGTTDIIFGAAFGENVVERNDFNRRGETVGGPDGCAVDFETSASGVVVRENTFYHPYGSGVMIFGHSTTSHGLMLTGNVFDHAGCVQTRNDHAGIAIMCPNGNKPSGTISDNTFATCEGVPAIWSNPAVPGCNSSIAFENNTINSAPIVAKPSISVLPTRTSPRALPFEATTTTPGATIRYTLDGSRPTEESPILDDLLLPWPAPAAAVNVRAFAPGMVPSVTEGKILELDRPWPLPGDGMRGSFDGLTTDDPPCLTGWVVDPTLSGGGKPPVNVSISIDGQLLSNEPAVLPRPDIVKAGLAPNPEHGIHVCLTSSQWGGLRTGSHAITATAVGSPNSTPRPWNLPKSPLCLSNGAAVPC